MNTTATNELREFSLFVGNKVNQGETSLTPEEVLDEWRELHPPELDEEEIAAIQEALDDMENGDPGMPIEEFDRKFRASHNLPPRMRT